MKPKLFVRSTGCLLFLITFFMITSKMQMAQEQEGPGTQISAELDSAVAGAPTQVVLGNLPEVTSTQAARPVPTPLRTALSETQYKALKQQALQRLGIADTPLPPTEAASSTSDQLLTPAANKTILPPNAAQESACGFFIPSDMGLAASTTRVVQVTNSCITVLNSSTGVKLSGFPKSLNAFFGLPSTHLTGDPRAIFDSAQQRFIVIAEDFSANNVALAASQTSDPAAGWNIYTFSMAPGCGDFPMLGQTLQENGDIKGGIYVSFNQFNCSSGAFIDDKVLILPKSKIYAGLGFSFFTFFNLTVGGVTVDSVQPANVVNKLDRPRSEFLINSFDFNFGGGACSGSGGCNGLTIWAINNGVPSSGSPSITGFVKSTANNYFFPADAPQPSCSTASCKLDTGTPHISGGVAYSSGSLYATVNSQKGVLLWEVHPTLNDAGGISTAEIRNEVCFACGGFSGGGQAYYGTIQPDSEGNFTMVYNFSDPATFPSTAYLSRRVTQAKNTVHDSGSILVSGQAFYKQLDQFGRNRWGDYTATAASYLTPNSYWFSGEFSQGNGNWGTAIGRNGYTSLTQP